MAPTPGGDAPRRLSARDAKNLQYTPQLPSFLQQLHAEVHGSRASRTPQHEEGDEADPVLAFLGETGGAAPKHEPAPRGDGYDSDDDLAHAQVVVLKEGKHLSKDEYLSERGKAEASTPEPRTCYELT